MFTILYRGKFTRNCYPISGYLVLLLSFLWPIILSVSKRLLTLCISLDSILSLYICYTVLYRRPDLDKDDLPSLILPTTYLCRYSLSINQENENDTPKVVSPLLFCVCMYVLCIFLFYQLTNLLQYFYFPRLCI